MPVMEPNQITYITETLVEVEENITSVMGDKYLLKQTKDEVEGVIGVVAKDFTLYYMEELKHFYLSFFVGTSGQTASLITRAISKTIEDDFFSTIEDSFWDSAANQMAFGDDAVHAKYRAYLDENNKVQCPLCNVIVYKNQMLPTGTCIHCKDLRSKISWN